MPTALEYFDIIAPEFVTLDNKEDYISIADIQVTDSIIQEQRNLIVAYLAAHIATISGRNAGAAGAISDLHEGNVSVSFNKSATKNGFAGVSDTSYGLEYTRLIKSNIFAPRTRTTYVY